MELNGTHPVAASRLRLRHQCLGLSRRLCAGSLWASVLRGHEVRHEPQDTDGQNLAEEKRQEDEIFLCVRGFVEK